PAMNAMVTNVCRCMELPCRGLTIRTNRRSYDRRWIASNVRGAPVPLGRLLECVRERKYSRFAEARSADLQTDRETGAAEAARNGNRRKAVDIEWLRVAQRRRDATRCRYRRIAQRVFNRLRQDRRRRRHEQIDGRKHLRDRPAQAIQLSLPLD